jgi:tetratricopeptide (TPR) repeat protein
MTSEKPPAKVIPFARPRRFPEDIERLRAQLDDDEVAFADAELDDAFACAEAAIERGVPGGLEARADLLNIRAHRTLAAGDKDGALAAWGALIALTPTYLPAYVARAKHLGEAGDHATVVAELDRFVTLSPTDARGYLHRADAYQAMGDLDRALANYRRAAQLDPTCGAAHLGMARQLTAKGDARGAKRAFAKAAEEVFGDAESYDMRGLFHFVSGQDELAEADYDASLALSPNDADALGFRGLCRLRLKRYDDAIRDFTRLIAMRPEEARGFWRRGEALVFSGRPAEALPDLERAIALEGDPTGAAHCARGMAQEALGQAAAALASYATAIERAPTNVAYRSRRFQMNQAAGDWERCLADVDALLAVTPDDAELLLSRARLCRRIGRRDDALAAYDRLIAKEPERADAYHERSDLQVGIGDTLAAMQDAARAFELAPDDLDIRAAHARFAAQLARTPEDRAAAFQLIESTAQLDADNPEAWARAADCYNGVSAHAECIRCYTRAIELDPDNAEYLHARARYRQCAAPREADDPAGHKAACEAALADVERALALSCDPPSEEDLGELLLRAELTEDLGDLQGALAQYTRILEAEPSNYDALTERARLRKLTGDMPGALADAAEVATMEEATIAQLASLSMPTNLHRFNLAEV